MEVIYGNGRPCHFGYQVIDIFEENAVGIEKMANKMIADLHTKNTKILDLQTTGDNLILVLGEKK